MYFQIHDVTIIFKHNGRMYTLPRRAHVIGPGSFHTVVTKFLNQYYPTCETTRNYSLDINYGHTGVMWGDKEEIVPNQEDKDGTLLHENNLPLEIYSVTIEFQHWCSGYRYNMLTLTRSAYVTNKDSFDKVVTEFLNDYYPTSEKSRTFSLKNIHPIGIDTQRNQKERIVPDPKVENRKLQHENYQM